MQIELFVVLNLPDTPCEYEDEIQRILGMCLIEPIWKVLDGSFVKGGYKL